MKKLIITAAIVCAAVMAQAAAVTWYTSSGTMNDGWKNTTPEIEGSYTAAAQSGTIMIFNNDATGIDQATVLSALFAGTADTLAMDSYASSNGKMASSAKKTLADPYSNFTPTGLDADEGTAIHYFYGMVITDTEGAKHAYVSDVYEKPLYTNKDTELSTSQSSLSKTFVGNTTEFSRGGWYTQAVPEPTSGLLLLLGVAGLALRRRRA